MSEANRRNSLEPENCNEGASYDASDDPDWVEPDLRLLKGVLTLLEGDAARAAGFTDG